MPPEALEIFMNAQKILPGSESAVFGRIKFHDTSRGLLGTPGFRKVSGTEDEIFGIARFDDIDFCGRSKGALGNALPSDVLEDFLRN